MDNLNEIIVRIKADTSSFNNPIDVLRGEIPQFWRGNDIRFEIGVFNGEDIWSVSNYGSISLAIRKLTDDGKVPSASTPVLMQKICTSFDDTLTSATWENGTKQHAVILFSSAESNVVAGDHWLSIWAITSDTTPKIITLCAGIVCILEVGGGNLSTPPDPIKIYYTSNECDDRFIQLVAINTNTNLGTSDSMVPSQGAVKTYVDQHTTSGQGEATSASNLGTGTAVFKEKIDGDLKFKTLKAGNNVTIAANDSEVTISSSTAASGEGMVNPMTTEGDLIVGGESGAAVRLEKGSDGQVLKSITDGLGWADESSSYTLPTASTNTLGGVKVGDNLTITDGVLSADDQSYTLPTASTNTLGGVKVGNNLTIANGVLSADDQSYTLPTASTNTLGGIKVGNNLTITDGVLSADDQSYTLPIATANALGGIKPDGTTITVDQSTGIASAVGGNGGGSGSSDDWTPSLQYVDITYGASADTYTAPADGWIYVECTTFNTNAYIIGKVILNAGTNTTVYGGGATTYSTNKDLFLLFPVANGRLFKMFNSNLNVNLFRFIYSKGAI
ncbi:MAG: hypothetical protein LBE98_02555 [Puniceicoccales bacterium]|jgi:hypothetical protein|nr:hypothetical protein [Puniceicoccales bacterium]